MSRLTRWAIAIALYAFAALVITYPLITVIGTRLVGHPFGDSTEYVRHAWALAESWRGNGAPYRPDLLLYPDGLDAGLLLAIPLQSVPTALLSLVMPLAPAFNLAALLTLILNGAAAYGLARALLADHAPRVREIAAWIAGLAFVGAPTFQGQLGAGHTGLLAVYPGVLLAWALVKILNRQDAKHAKKSMRVWIGVGAVALAASGWGSLALLVYFTLPIVVGIGGAAVVQRQWRAIARMAIAGVIGGALLLVTIAPAWGSLGATTASANRIAYSAPIIAIGTPSFYHPLAAGLDHARAIYGVDPFELAGYVGWSALALMVIAVVARSSRANHQGTKAHRHEGLWMALALVGWVLSWGAVLKFGAEPVIVTVAGVTTPIALPGALLEAIPLLNTARTPARFAFASALGAAMLIGIGAAAVLRGVGARAGGRGAAIGQTVVAVVIAAVLLIDRQWWWGVPTIDGAPPAAIAALNEGTARAVFNIPWDHPLVDKEALWLQTAHGLPLIGGHIARETPLDPARATILQTTLDPARLRHAGADLVILHRQWDDADGALEAHARAILGDPRYEDARFAIFAVP